MKQSKKSLVNKLSNEARIRELEEIIPLLIKQVNNSNPKDFNYRKFTGKLDEYKLEYRERTGEHFKVTKPYRRHEDGAI